MSDATTQNQKRTPVRLVPQPISHSVDIITESTPKLQDGSLPPTCNCLSFTKQPSGPGRELSVPRKGDAVE